LNLATDAIHTRNVRFVLELVAYCGLDCGKCDAFAATQARDLQRKTEIAKRWTQGLKVEFKPEDVECMGCMSNRISGWCTRVCKIRPCADARGVKTCAHCADYPCEKLKQFLSDEPKAAETLERIRKTVAV